MGRRRSQRARIGVHWHPPIIRPTIIALPKRPRRMLHAKDRRARHFAAAPGRGIGRGIRNPARAISCFDRRKALGADVASRIHEGPGGDEVEGIHEGPGALQEGIDSCKGLPRGCVFTRATEG